MFLVSSSVMRTSPGQRQQFPQRWHRYCVPGVSSGEGVLIKTFQVARQTAGAHNCRHVRHESTTTLRRSSVMSQRPTLILLSSQASLPAAVEEWAADEDWVRWLFSGIRARMEVLTAGAEVLATEGAVRAAWQEFAQRLVGPESVALIHQVWRAVQRGDADEWLQADTSWLQGAAASASARSMEAGALLFAATRGARYQGILGRIRALVDEGRGKGHVLPVWLAVGSFFQLGLAPILAEYLRLEWEMLSRRVPGGVLEPLGGIGLTALTGQIVRTSTPEGGRLSSAV